MAGFNFSEEDEAKKFYRTVMEKVRSKTERNETKLYRIQNETISHLIPNINTNGFQKSKAPLANQPVSLNSMSASTFESTNLNQQKREP